MGSTRIKCISTFCKKDILGGDIEGEEVIKRTLPGDIDAGTLKISKRYQQVLKASLIEFYTPGLKG